MSDIPLPGDGQLHLSDADFESFIEQVAGMALKLTDGKGLKVFCRYDSNRVRAMAFDMLSQLMREAGKGEPHYDLVLGGVE